MCTWWDCARLTSKNSGIQLLVKDEWHFFDHFPSVLTPPLTLASNTAAGSVLVRVKYHSILFGCLQIVEYNFFIWFVTNHCNYNVYKVFEFYQNQYNLNFTFNIPPSRGCKFKKYTTTLCYLCLMKTSNKPPTLYRNCDSRWLKACFWHLKHILSSPHRRQDSRCLACFNINVYH